MDPFRDMRHPPIDNAYDERIETPDSDFFSDPYWTEKPLTVGTDMSIHELKGSFVEQPPEWQPTVSGRVQTNMETFFKTHFPNGMYIPGYMLWPRD